MHDSTPPDLRVRRAFAFVDVCGFTQVADRCGDDAAIQILARFRSHIRKTCGHHGVRVGKWLGDGAMLVGVDPIQLVCAAATIVHGPDPSGPPVRGGVTVGDVLVFEGDDYIGRTVNLAARLCDHAEADELLVQAGTGLVLPPSLRVTNRSITSVRGVQAPVDVFAVRATAADGTRSRQIRAVAVAGSGSEDA